MEASINMLVIDDNEDDRLLYQRTFRKINDTQYGISEAEDRETGLARIAEVQPDCVLLDYSLPGDNGIEVLKCIRSRYPHLPVIMLTGQGNEVVAVQSMKEGAQDYIIKNTITPEMLQRVIRVAIEHGTLQKRIHEQRTSLEIFTRALAHDLKEPVRTICSFVDRIGDWRNLNEKSQKSFEYIRNAALRMNALIDTVYLYTRLDATEQMEETPCDIAEVLKEVQENLARLMEERHAAVTCDTLPQIQANRVQMIQLFQNLISNAVRHSESAVNIHVSAREQENHWQIAVRDDGPGIEAEYLETIFDPFKRLSHRKEEGPGLGLGLAINRKIVELHGGKIWCESEVGTGTSFLFTLPKAIAAATSKSAVAVSAPSLNVQSANGAQTRARILLVDDNEADIDLNRIMLVEDAKLNCDVLAACDGEAALSMLRDAVEENNPVDLLLLDINMPGMSGFELMAHMNKEKPLLHPLVVICSTSAYDMDKKMAASLGAAGYLTKPPQFSLLKDIIDRCQGLRLCHEGNDFVLLRAA